RLREFPKAPVNRTEERNDEAVGRMDRIIHGLVSLGCGGRCSQLTLHTFPVAKHASITIGSLRPNPWSVSALSERCAGPLQTDRLPARSKAGTRSDEPPHRREPVFPTRSTKKQKLR